MRAPVLVVGAGGQVGGALLTVLGPQAVGSWRQPSPGGLAADLEDLAERPGAAADLVGRAGAEVVYVAAGMTHVDGCEADPDRAARVNRDGPAALARAAAAAGATTVYLSTEYVFDGTVGPYGEDDPVRPLSVYGRTKAEGEQAVLDADPAALVVRTTVVYGPEAHGRNTAYQLAGRLLRGEPVQAPADQVTSPTYNRDLVAGLVGLLEAGATGVVNVAGPEVVDRATFARRLAAAMGFDPERVRAIATADLRQVAPRPLAAGLRLDRVRALVPGFVPRSAEDAVAAWEQEAPDVPWRSS